VDNCLVEIAQHFEALSVTLTDLRDIHADHPDLMMRIDIARHRALRGAELARARIARLAD